MKIESLDPKLQERVRAQIRADVTREYHNRLSKMGKALAEGDLDAIKLMIEQQRQKEKKRIRQSSKPLMNKLETEFYERIKDRNYRETYVQSLTFKLANGVKYTPDICVIGATGTDCYEIKGPKMWDDAVVKIKVAASIYPRIHWWMVWKKEGVWMDQKIVP